MITPTHLAALHKVYDALSDATEVGALDFLLNFVSNPDSINDVCDSIEVALKDPC